MYKVGTKGKKGKSPKTFYFRGNLSRVILNMVSSCPAGVKTHVAGLAILTQTLLGFPKPRVI